LNDIETCAYLNVLVVQTAYSNWHYSNRILTDCIGGDYEQMSCMHILSYTKKLSYRQQIARELPAQSNISKYTVSKKRTAGIDVT